MSMFHRRSTLQDQAVQAPQGPANPVRLVIDSAGAPAVDLDKVGRIDLRKKADKAGIALAKRSLNGIRAQAVLLLDHSASMRSLYKDGTVQTMVERALGFALQIDADGIVPVLAFDWQVHSAVNVTADNYQGIVDREIWRNGKMGSTNLAAALQDVRSLAADTDAPLFVVVVTDGSPDDRRAATDEVCELSRYPAFLKFLAVDRVDYLDQLDADPSLNGRRLIDNVNSQDIPDPAGMSDLAFAEAMVAEWDDWITRALTAGVLTR